MSRACRTPKQCTCTLGMRLRLRSCGACTAYARRYLEAVAPLFRGNPAYEGPRPEGKEVAVHQ